MKKAVIYARYSSDRQTEQSIEGQLRVCNEFASRQGYTVIATYIDRAMTGTNDNREQFQKMIKDSESKIFETVLVYKLDRFSRNRYDSAMNKNILKKNGVKLVSATEPITDTPEGILLESVLEGMAEFYSAELSQKVKRGMKESRSKGLFTGGLCLYGYRIVNQRYEIEPNEAKVVRMLFDDLISGYKLKDIANKLERLGITLRNGNRMSAGRISFLLHNEKYIGKCVIAGVEYPNMVPAIIDPITFEKAQRILAKGLHKNAKAKASIPYYLSGKIFCEHCGSPFIGSAGTSKTKKVHHYYKCSNKVKNTKNCCSHVYKKEELEEFVLDSIVKTLSIPSNFNKIIEHMINLYDSEIKTNLNIKRIQKELENVDEELTNYATAIGKGIFNDKIQEIMNSLLDRKSMLETELKLQESLKERELTEEILTKHLSSIFSYKGSDENTKRCLFDAFIKQITINDNDNITIYCNGVDEDFVLKNEHLDKVFAYDTLGGAGGN